MMPSQSFSVNIASLYTHIAGVHNVTEILLKVALNTINQTRLAVILVIMSVSTFITAVILFISGNAYTRI
jgi:hypothetical protein